MKKNNYRIEQDSLGKVKVPKNALYGAQTQRAIDNFKISGITFDPAFIQALASLKNACALANVKCKILPKVKASAISNISKKISLKPIDFIDHFPIDIFQTGSGTSTNMNMNEVISEIAKRTLKRSIHPNDDVNMSQSSNDVIPTTINISSLTMSRTLSTSLDFLCDSLNKKAKNLKDIIKSGRTHLMDAVPISFEQELNVWEEQVRASQAQIDLSCEEISYLPIGGTAIGTGINAPKSFSKNVCNELNKIYHELKIKFKPLTIKGEMMSSQNHILTLSSALTRYASTLLKIANDIRWMNSGPISGLSEISLKALQPGSSIMPGKINPVISESIMMAAVHVNGNHFTIMQASSSGSFQLNTMLPVIAHNIIESLYLMINCSFSMIDLVDSFSVNEEAVRNSLFKNPIIATKLNQVIGYDMASKIVKEAYKTNSSIFDIAEKMTSLTKAELVKILDPKKLI
jgi:fumarate hydratase class II